MKYLLSAFLIFGTLFAQQNIPKREFRGAWIATVTNLDWPSSRTLAPAAQRNELILLLDGLKSAGINAVIFQIRTECDAFYPSPYEPWSYWLTGKQGTAPADNYDPLAFAVGESHKRGMEIHAWFNPYRAERVIGNYTAAANHITKTHPDWTVTVGTYKFMNPGMQEVRDHVTRVIGDVVRRYAVDGVHMDDYFYPYEGITYQDTLTFKTTPRGFSYPDSIKPWRRDNVNLLIKQIYDTVNAVKPWVKFGMSPFGIWRNGVPAGTTGLDAYSTIYCDAPTWLQRKMIDYITPQLYWAFGGSQDYGKLEPWWGSITNGRHLYTGNAAFNIGSFGPASEVANQLRLNRTNPNCQGSIQFRAKSVTANLGGFLDTLKTDIFRYPAAVPVMGWKETVPPNPPQNIRIIAGTGSLPYGLVWDPPAAASDGDTAQRYLVYRFSSLAPSAEEKGRAKNVIALTGIAAAEPPSRVDTNNVQYYFAVTSLDKNNNESDLSNLASLPGGVSATILQGPADGEKIGQSGTFLRWQKNLTASAYGLQIASSSSFSTSALLISYSVKDTFYALSTLPPQRHYFWRVNGGNQLAAGPCSAVRSFFTGWPLPPVLFAPPVAFNISRKPVFIFSREGGISFTLQVATSDFSAASIVLDTTVADTSVVITRSLNPEIFYQWRVMAINSYGSSAWSAVSRFKTEPLTSAAENIPQEIRYSLEQNYPNPYNPSTMIRFSLMEPAQTTITVYDLLGRIMTTLLNDNRNAGIHSVQFDGSKLPSGVYFYRIVSGTYVEQKKMILQK